MRTLIRDAVKKFCLEFVEDPYLSYTEHGQHALFFERLYRAIPPDMRYFKWEGNRACVIQKEYPTATNLGKSTRQHWDIAVIRLPPKTVSEKNGFDYLHLEAVVEFGMNEEFDHLEDDVQRVSHSESNLAFGFIVHFHRLSVPGAHISGRDWSPRSSRIVRWDDLDERFDRSPRKWRVEGQSGWNSKGITRA